MPDRFATLLTVILAALGVALAVAGCGGEDPAERRAELRGAAEQYATQVATITGETERQLATTAGEASFEDAAAAQQATTAYATAIRGAAGRLDRVKPPASLRGLHRQLVTLYRQTAVQLDALGVRFKSPAEGETLPQLAQEFATALKSYATQEAQLRGQLDAALSKLAGEGATSPAPTTP